MKAIHDRADARFHPSRFHFALFRLIAWMRYRNATPQERKGLLLIIDRDQTAWEQYVVAGWYVLTMACFTSALFGINVALALPVFLLLVYPLLCVIGVPLRNRNNVRAQSMFFMAVMLGAAMYYAFADSWIRFAAWQCLGVAALNACCAMILFALREALPSAA